MKIKTIPSCWCDRLVLLSVKQAALDSVPIFSSPATPAPLPSWRMIAPPCSITISSAKSKGSKNRERSQPKIQGANEHIVIH